MLRYIIIIIYEVPTKMTEMIPSIVILGDPGAVSRVDKMFVVKVYCKI